MRDSIDRKIPFQTLAAGLLLTAFVGVAAYRRFVPAEPLTPNPYPQEVVQVPVHPLEDFNGVSREGLCAQRQAQYAAFPAGAKAWPGYQSTGSKFVSEVDWSGSWVGIDGLAQCNRESFPQGFRRGLSLVSATWLNPHLPVLVSPCKFELGLPETPPGGLTPDVLPASAELDGPHRRLTVTYKMTGALTRRSRPPHVFLDHFNAREQGFTHFAVRAAEGLRYMPNGNANHPDGSIMNVDQDLRAIQAGGIKANMLYIRTDSFVTYDLAKLPARLEISLWRDDPQEMKTPADLTEVILLDGPAQGR